MVAAARHARTAALALVCCCAAVGAAAQAAAPTVALAGSLGSDKALLVIDGQTVVLAVGASRQGVLLRSLQLHGDSDFQIGQVRDLLTTKLSKRGVDMRFLDFSAKIEKMGGDKVRQTVPVKQGIDAETAKKIQGLIKNSKLKVQAAIQGDSVRCTGAKRDDLQAAMALLRKEVADMPLAFNNFRD